MTSVVEEIIKIDSLEKKSIKLDEEKFIELFALMKKDPYLTSAYKRIEANLSYYNSLSSAILAMLPTINSYVMQDGERIYSRDRIYLHLEEVGFNFDSEIRLAMKSIMERGDLFDSYDAYNLQDHYGAGYKGVKEITFDDVSYTIIDQKGAEYKVYRADKYFSKKPEVLQYISNNYGKNNCHGYTEELQKYFPEGVSITSYIKRWTGDNFYTHSYMELDGMIVDLTLNMVMDKETYYRLNKPKEIIRIKNSEIKKYQEILSQMIESDPNKEMISNNYLQILLAEYYLACQNNPELYQSMSSIFEFDEVEKKGI